MKNRLSFIIAVLFCTSIVAQTKEVIFKFNHLYDGAPFNTDQIYLVDDDVQINFSRMEYYLHVNSLIGAPDHSFDLDDQYLLVNSDQSTYSIGSFPVEDMYNVQFHIGVAEDVNHNDPALLPSSHPLAPQANSMHWGWAAGYIFVAAEGMVDKNQDGILEAVIQYHAVEDDYYTPLLVSGAGYETETTLTYFIDVHYDKMFENLNCSNAGVFHGPHDENALLISNMATNDVFTASENLNLESISTTTQAYPNPFTDHIQIQLQNESNILIYNSLGVLIESFNLNEGVHRLNQSSLTPGLYILQIQNAVREEKLRLYKI